MDDRELLDQAKELVDKVYENMGDVEKYNMAKGKVLLGEVGIIMPEDGRAMTLKEFLSEEQHNIIVDSIIACIDSNLEHARNFLRCANAVNEGMKLGAMAEEMVKECEGELEVAEVVPEPEGEVKPAEVTRRAPTKEELAEDLANGLKLCEISKKYGYKHQGSITALLGKYGLDKRGKMAEDKVELMKFVEEHFDEIKVLYTNGPFTLKKLAVEYSVDQKLLHEVLAAKGLLKNKK